MSGANMFVFADLGPSLINDKTRCKSGLVISNLDMYYKAREEQRLLYQWTSVSLCCAGCKVQSQSAVLPAPPGLSLLRLSSFLLLSADRSAPLTKCDKIISISPTEFYAFLS